MTQISENVSSQYIYVTSGCNKGDGRETNTIKYERASAGLESLRRISFQLCVGSTCWSAEVDTKPQPEAPFSPQGVVHTTGGYMLYVATTFKYVFDFHPEDVFWCTADIGWITGHSYVTYGPLANGATSVLVRWELGHGQNSSG